MENMIKHVPNYDSLSFGHVIQTYLTNRNLLRITGKPNLGEVEYAKHAHVYWNVELDKLLKEIKDSNLPFDHDTSLKFVLKLIILLETIEPTNEFALKVRYIPSYCFQLRILSPPDSETF